MQTIKEVNEYMTQARIDFSNRRISAEQLSSMEIIALAMIDNLNIQSCSSGAAQNPDAPILRQ